MPEYPHDIIDGQSRPPLVVKDDFVLTGTHRGAVHVESGHFTLAGTQQGSLHLHNGASAELAGLHQGSLHADRGCRIQVTGVAQGSAHLAPDSVLVVEDSGKLQGSLHNDGTVLVRGVFGGSQHGPGEVSVEGNGRIQQPRIVDGMNYYEG